MYFPKHFKYNKAHKGPLPKGISVKSNQLAFGSFGLKTLEEGKITPKQIEATRIVISKNIKRYGKFWIRVFPDILVTKKPNEVRMGKGKGSFSHWICKIKKGRILFEIDGIEKEKAKKILNLARYKLPIKTKLIIK
jgi:large subunit ribosomal protein L16